MGIDAKRWVIGAEGPAIGPLEKPRIYPSGTQGRTASGIAQERSCRMPSAASVSFAAGRIWMRSLRMDPCSGETALANARHILSLHE